MLQVEVLEEKINTEVDEADDLERQKLLGALGIEETQNKKSVRFPEMSAGQMNVITELFPVKMEALEYANISYVPTPVLRVIHANKETFTKMYVYSDKKSDPVLVGELKDKNRSWADGTMFLMARWGLSLEPFSKLTEIAKQQWAEKRKGMVAALSVTIEADAVKHFNGESVLYLG